ncbi:MULTISPECIES: hypothetical protein [Providencia]|uniref:Flagella biosynthesis protein FliZ n=4 Tax=Enterobacterales TaxID=91347 RepID=A0A9N8H1U0_PRORE|nr:MULTISPECIES: hypothetical protein [Providencia]ELR5097709.1 hypothetical protein [Providencia rettgeri]ELR5101055.1 hypothetical protein [Providencia rettgeri]EMC8781244.1 hypothetical protein [Providencia rettgeri]MDE4734844.1 hypothetical protein [Providencia rettgeri]MDH2397923.1 hypothetical protein [Providencia rettgeri]
MARKKSKIRTLRQYLIEFKDQPHRCSCCQVKLNRVSLMLDGVAINKEDISHLSQQLNVEEWHTLQTTRLKVLCRFCRELHTPPLSVFFDLVGFQHYLLVDLSMKPSSVREYVLRLRRIDTLLVTLNIDMPRLNVTQIKGILAEHYSKQSLNNAGPALNQYADYVTECLVNVMAAGKACFNVRS